MLHFAPPSPPPIGAPGRAERIARGRRRAQRRNRWRAGLALALAIAVPAFAAPEEWQGLSGDARAVDGAPTAPLAAPMPFEKRGWSFPGSALYYLEDAPRLALRGAAARGIDTAPGAIDPLAHWNGDPARAIEIHEAGPAARAFHSAGTGLDKARALQCLASAVYYEAASESVGGQRAVAQVVLNRVAHPAYPRSVCGVVFQGSERATGCQFSFTCDGSLRRKPTATGWARAIRVAQQALSGQVYAPVGLATHYHTAWVDPYWAAGLDHIGTIGAHRFYRWRGLAGQASAFAATYSGGEPLPGPHPPAHTARGGAAPASDPISLARAYEDAKRKAEEEAAAASGQPRPAPSSPPAPSNTAPAAPRYSPQVEAKGGDAQFRADGLPGSGSVKPEYRNSGRWIGDPR